jgi:hypothetical protein
MTKARPAAPVAVRPATRYTTAVAVAALLTGGIATQHHSVTLLAGVAVVSAVAAAFALRHRDVLLGHEYAGVASGAFGGAATFGALSLALGLGEGFHLGAAVLGYGLAAVGFVTGVAAVRES